MIVRYSIGRQSLCNQSIVSTTPVHHSTDKAHSTQNIHTYVRCIDIQRELVESTVSCRLLAMAGPLQAVLLCALALSCVDVSNAEVNGE